MRRVSLCEQVAQLLVIAIFLTIACTSTGLTDPPGPDATELLIDLAVFPEGWGVTGQWDDSDELRAPSAVVKEFATRTSELHIAAHHVSQYASERRAQRVFRISRSAEFNSNSIASLTPWEPPPELPYVSSVADQFYFACHLGKIKQTVQVCEALGQYANYLVIFHTHIVPGFMSFEDLETILKTIDARMAEIRDG